VGTWCCCHGFVMRYLHNLTDISENCVIRHEMCCMARHKK
jgi:hypothetical protein